MANKIPKLFHFVFGLREQTEPFHLVYYLCLRSCIEVNNPDRIHFYYVNEPYGEYWDLIKSQLTLIKIEPEFFVLNNRAYADHPEGHFIKEKKLDYAHQADFIRLKKLIEYGGVYADMDTLFVNPIPESLYEHAFVIGREENVLDSKTQQTVPSLCNALLMSESGSEFAQAWLEKSYEAFDGSWSSHSCQLAASLATKMPGSVYVAPQQFFFKHMWTKEGIDTLFKGLDVDFNQVFSMHLWNHLWWDQSRVDFSDFHSGLITESHIKEKDTTYNVIARRFLPITITSSEAKTHSHNSVKKEASMSSAKSSATILIPEIDEGWELIQCQDQCRLSQIESAKEFAVNEITNLILAMCDGVKSVNTIINTLVKQFPNSEKEISHDVQTILRQLALNGAIRFKQIPILKPRIPNVLPPPSNNQPKLCIGMATYDDYDGVYFSVQAIRLYHPEVLDDIEIVVLDNNPTGICAEALKNLGHSIPNYRYIEGDNFQGTWSRFSLINQTYAPYILCMDSHVMIVPGAIHRLISYLDKHPTTQDFLQGPLVGDDLQTLSSHFTPGWGAGMYGKWESDSRANEIDNDPFDIPMQGLGLFAFRKDSWPKVNPRFKGFGGEEGYVHEKIRRAGGRTLCLPFLRWIHRFNRPMGAKYALNWEDRIRNYMIAHDELGIDNDEMFEHFNTLIGVSQMESIKSNIERELEGPFNYFDAIYCINIISEQDKWLHAKAQFEQMEIDHRVQHFPAFETPDNHHIGCALSHRTIIQLAKINRFKNVLILEDDVVFDSATLNHLAQSLLELETVDWDVLYLGAHCWDKRYLLAQNCEHLREITSSEFGPTCTHAIVYNESCYETLLTDLPGDIEGITTYLEQNTPAIDQYLAKNSLLKRFIVEPRVASQPALLKQESERFSPIN